MNEYKVPEDMGNSPTLNKKHGFVRLLAEGRCTKSEFKSYFCIELTKPHWLSKKYLKSIGFYAARRCFDCIQKPATEKWYYVKNGRLYQLKSLFYAVDGYPLVKRTGNAYIRGTIEQGQVKWPNLELASSVMLKGGAINWLTKSKRDFAQEFCDNWTTNGGTSVEDENLVKYIWRSPTISQEKASASIDVVALRAPTTKLHQMRQARGFCSIVEITLTAT